MDLDAPSKERRPSLWLPTLGMTLATPFLVWFAIGDVSFGGPGRVGQSHEFGPYQVGPESGYIIGGLAAVIALAAFAVLVLRTRQGAVSWWWWAAVVTLAGAGSLGASGWRIATAGVTGANIGGGFAVLLGPLMIAGLLVLAVWFAFIAGQERAPNGSGARRRLKLAGLLTVAAVLVAPGLFAIEDALVQYQLTLPQHDDAVGLITPRQYADVRSGQTRAAVQKKLGPQLPPLGDSDPAWQRQYFPFRPPAPPGLLCDDYLGADYTIEYRFCFRGGVLANKASHSSE